MASTQKPNSAEIDALVRGASVTAGRISRCLTRCQRIRASLTDMRQRAQDAAYSQAAREAYARNADEAEADLQLKEAELPGLFARLDATVRQLRANGVEPPGALLKVMAARQPAAPDVEEG